MQRLVHWWVRRTQCRHDKLVDTLLEAHSSLFGALLQIQGWSIGQVDNGRYVHTLRGSHTIILPIKCIGDKDVAVILTLGTINQTPIYGVMGFQVGDNIVGYRDFPLEVRLQLQMCPSYQDVVLIFETDIIPCIGGII